MAWWTSGHELSNTHKRKRKSALRLFKDSNDRERHSSVEGWKVVYVAEKKLFKDQNDREIFPLFEGWKAVYVAEESIKLLH